MDPARWQRLRPLLEQALDLDDRAAQMAFVDALGDNHAELREELRALVVAHANAPPLHSPAVALAQQAVSTEEADVRADAERVGSEVGGYRLMQLLGSGGMGAVYLAERSEGGFRQRVALKLVRSHLHGGSARLRFTHERQILAQLRHAHIAALLDGGEADDGAPYFTLEYVDGESITQYCRNHGLGIAARLRLLTRVGAALAYAHRNLVVHRDIKPSNVLVDREGQVKLLDFGIAKLVGDTPGISLTQHRTPGPMTPEYAAPEQFRGGRITAATDVYQFGVLLFRLLSGRLPYRADVRDAAAWAHAVTAEEPLRLAQALDTRGSSPGADEGLRERIAESIEPAEFSRLRRALRGDLEAIVRKALAKLPDERYLSMDALVADLEAMLDGRPVSAQRATPLYQLNRFVQRHFWLVAAFTLLLLALALSTGLALQRARQAQLAAESAGRQAERAQRESARARAMQGFIAELFQVDDPGINRGEQLSANAMLESGARRLASADFADAALRADLEMLLGRAYESIGEMRRAQARFEAALSALRLRPDTPPAQLAMALERSAFASARTGQAQLADERLGEARRLNIAVDATSVAYHLDLRATESALARDRGDLNRAEAIARDALTLARRLEPTVGSERTVAALSRLGTILADRGQYVQAETLLREAHAMAVRLFGDGDLRSVQALQTLGWMYIGMQRLEEASTILEDVRLRLQGLVGTRSLRYGLNAHNRGLLYTSQGDFRRALQAFTEAAEIAAEVAGPESLERGWALTNVGWTQLRLGDAAAAVHSFELEGRAWQANLPADSPIWAAHHYSMARGLLGAGALDEARRCIERSVNRYRQLGDGERFGLLRSLILQAAILRALGDELAAAATDAEVARGRATMPQADDDFDAQIRELASLARRR